ncbi:HAD domain-containing protein [Variovorax sp. J31P207]|uniref:HAD domain-containing protein n=1 Tax=Variovorax sp. J31P207 TaxID=3053510 RepID=UPI002574C72C|nr:HAD domain-containing protein [Variovorax sp. J31P207]MDM0071464.1 HAD domain-containing protein [Variovorax sp. J31P207]
MSKFEQKTQESQHVPEFSAAQKPARIPHGGEQHLPAPPTPKPSTRTDAPIYLGLDFDGVLHSVFAGPRKQHCTDLGAGLLSPVQFIRDVNVVHDPEWCGRLFDRADLLSDCLDGFHREVRIVIATSWRSKLSTDTMRELLPSSLRKRVVDSLDSCEEQDHNGECISGVRGRLMERWVAINDPGADWLALDDVDELWAEHMLRLVQTPPMGVNLDAIDRLRVALAASRA